MSARHVDKPELGPWSHRLDICPKRNAHPSRRDRLPSSFQHLHQHPSSRRPFLGAMTVPGVQSKHAGLHQWRRETAYMMYILYVSRSFGGSMQLAVVPAFPNGALSSRCSCNALCM